MFTAELRKVVILIVYTDLSVGLISSLLSTSASTNEIRIPISLFRSSASNISNVVQQELFHAAYI